MELVPVWNLWQFNQKANIYIKQNAEKYGLQNFGLLVSTPVGWYGANSARVIKDVYICIYTNLVLGVIFIYIWVW